MRLFPLLILVGCTLVHAAPVDEKTGHLDLRLGSKVGELRHKVVSEEKFGFRYRFRFATPQERFQTPPLRDIRIAFPRPATFGGVDIIGIRLFYLDEILCSIRLDFTDGVFDFPKGKTREQYQQDLAAVADGLVSKYGKPTYPGEEEGDYRASCVWVGDDIDLVFSNADAGFMRNRAEQLVGVLIESKSAFRTAEEQLVRKFKVKEDEIKAKGKSLEDDL